MTVREARERLAARRPQFGDDMDALVLETVALADYLSARARRAYRGAQLAETLGRLEGCDRGDLLRLTPIIERDARRAPWLWTPSATTVLAETDGPHDDDQ